MVPKTYILLNTFQGCGEFTKLTRLQQVNDTVKMTSWWQPE